MGREQKTKYLCSALKASSLTKIQILVLLLAFNTKYNYFAFL